MATAVEGLARFALDLRYDEIPVDVPERVPPDHPVRTMSSLPLLASGIHFLPR